MFAITHENGVNTIMHNKIHDLERLKYNGVVVWRKLHISYIMTYNVEAGEEVQLVSGTANPGFTADMVNKFIVDGVSTPFTKTYTFSTSGEHKVEMEVLQDNLSVLPAYGFANCPKLIEVEIPEGVVTISDNSFRDCPVLETVYVPTTTETFGISCFENCSALHTVTVK